MDKLKKKKLLRDRRKTRQRAKISGTQDRPRLSVFKSSRHVFAQVIDDTAGRTIASASSFEKGNNRVATTEVCKEIGELLAKRCIDKKVSKIVFDTNGNKYHGRVKALAEGARAAGLVF